MSLDYTNEDIINYLEIMKKLLLDKKTKIKYLKNRDKNFVFSYLYSIDIKTIIEIILSLNENEFLEKVKDKDEEFENRVLYIWHPIRNFTAADGEEREIELYIKTDIYDENKIVVVISFHKIDDYS